VKAAGSELMNKLAEVLAGRTEILEAYLFGSQARGTAQAHSDVDVAVYVDPATDLDRGFGMDAFGIRKAPLAPPTTRRQSTPWFP